ncbi:MAG TPA: ABC transporter permease [Vicinamibacterales bacterium]
MTEFRSTVSHLRRHPGFVVGAALSLALGMALATMVFSMVDALFTRTTPFVDSDRLVTVYKVPRGASDGSPLIPIREIVALRERAKTIDGLASWHAGSHTIGRSGDARDYAGASVTSTFFDVLRVRPAIGRLFHGSSGGGATGAVVLSHSVWQQQFGADPAIVGRTISVDGIARPVIGVLKSGDEFPRETAIWTLLPDDSLRSASSEDRAYPTIGRLAAGANREMLAAEAAGIFHATETEEGLAQPFRCRVASLAELEASAYRESIELWVAAALVIIMLCAVNFATMMLARGMRRRGELAVRSALGAPSSRIVALLVSEAAAIAMLAGGVAATLAFWGLGAVRAMLGASMSARPVLDWRAAVFAILGTTVVGVLFCLLPSIDLARADIRRLLSGGTTVTHSARELRGRRGLIALQIGLALMCTAVVLSVVRADLRDYSRGPGYAYENIITAKLHVTDERGWSEAGLLGTIRSTPGVVDATIRHNLEAAGFKPENGPPELFPHLAWSDVPASYFSVLGIRLVAGRLPTQIDVTAGAPVMVLSELDRRFMARDSTTSYVGRRYRMTMPGGGTVFYTVIGIVADVRAAPDFKAMTAPVYTIGALRAPRAGATLSVRIQGDRRAQIERIRDALRSYDSRIVISDLHAASDDVTQWRLQSRARVTFLVAVAALALLLAAIGVYGLTSYTTALRMRELAIRRALGASDRGIVGLLMRDLGWLAATGVVLGALLATRAVIVLDSVIRSPYDPRSLVNFQIVPTAVGASILLLIAGVGAVIPARRALRADVARVVASDG